ncbi:MAG: CDP-diacylglycerol--glycerol-3-phosphate 3-phosphatidyltransferase [Pseudomonadota bacterium]
MLLNTPNILTLLRIALIPAFIAAYYWAHPSAHMLATGLFVLAALTDMLDGYLARKWEQTSPFGAFLDPVADKLMVAAALVMLVADPRVQAHVLDIRLFGVVVLVIVGREITVSALREWMSEVGKRSHVAVSFVGKIKTVSQMVAIPFLLWQKPLWGLPIFRIGEILLYVAAALTLWSMLIYLKAAWPNLIAPRRQ